MNVDLILTCILSCNPIIMVCFDRSDHKLKFSQLHIINLVSFLQNFQNLMGYFPYLQVKSSEFLCKKGLLILEAFPLSSKRNTGQILKFS